MAEWIFYVSLALLFYTFFGYPLLLFILSLFIKREVIRDDIRPEVTIIIPVHNEERSIGEKIENCLGFEYPREKLKIIVASDGSTDKTEEIVKGFESGQVQFLPLPSRGGKVAAQNYAVQLCDSEIIIFTDVAILTHPDCVKLIVQNFFDKRIGGVSCRDVIIGEKSKGEESYIKYDMIVRKYTSQIGSIIGVTGGFYAVRKEIAEGGWNPAFPPDFYVAIRCIQRGLRVIEDPRVRANYKTAARGWDEFPRKVRTINRGMYALFSGSNRNLLNPFKYGFVSLELISHKLLRWMMPFFLIALFVSNFLVLDISIIADFLFLLQLGWYFIAVIGFLMEKKINKSILKLAFYFVIANMAILNAWYEFAIGKKYVLWQPTKR
jgi:glycosyltransferase involved in cell wall biosynthesis